MIDEGLLNDALSRRTLAAGLEIGELVRLADMAGSLPFPGPDGAARARMTTRFDDYITGRSRPGIAAWIAGWMGVGPRPRTVVQRLAAGGVILLASASSASAATGQTPIGIATGIASFAENLIHNLAPRPDDTSVPLATATSTPSPAPTLTPTPTATPTPPPPAAATTSPSNTPEAADDSGTAGQAPRAEPSATPTPPTPTPTTAGQKQGVYSAGDGGSVRLGYNSSSLYVLAVQPNHGWQFTMKQSSGQRVEVTFTNSVRRLTFSAAMEDGQPVIQVRMTLPAPENTRLPFPGVTRIPTATPTPDHQGETEGDALSTDTPPGVAGQ